MLFFINYLSFRWRSSTISKEWKEYYLYFSASFWWLPPLVLLWRGSWPRTVDCRQAKCRRNQQLTSTEGPLLAMVTMSAPETCFLTARRGWIRPLQTIILAERKHMYFPTATNYKKIYIQIIRTTECYIILLVPLLACDVNVNVMCMYLLYI